MKKYPILLLIYLITLQGDLLGNVLKNMDINAEKIKGKEYYVNNKIRIYQGNATINGDLNLEYFDDENKSSSDYFIGVVVEGDLHVNGNVINFEDDYGKFLQVGGSLFVNNLLIGGSRVDVKNKIVSKYFIRQNYNHGEIFAKEMFAPVLLAPERNPEIISEVNVTYDISRFSEKKLDDIFGTNENNESYFLNKEENAKLALEKVKKYFSWSILDVGYRQKKKEGKESKDIYDFLKVYAQEVKIGERELNISTISKDEIAKITYLDLSNSTIYEVPDYFLEFHALEELDMHDCELRVLSSNITNIKSLKILNLSSNKIRILPNSIKNLKNLEKLSLYSTGLAIISKKIKELKKLKYLDLSVNYFDAIPDEVYELENLEYLNLSRLYIPISDKIKNLKNLKNLNLQGNLMKKLPIVFTELKALEKLDIYSNAISKLPDEIEKLENLQVLKMGANRMKEIPEVLTRLKKLRELKITISDITTIPSYISEFKSLKHLDLSNNDIEDINVTFPNLEYLDLSDTKLKFIPKSVSEIKSLKYLELDSIEHIDENIGELKNLETLILDVYDKNITTLPKSFVNLQKLENLDIRYNPFPEIPSVIFSLNNLKKLEMYNCKVKKIPAEIKKLKKLKILSLGRNNIIHIHENIGTLVHLTSLSLYENNIKFLPVSLKNLQRLEYLDISDNPIENLPSELIEDGEIEEIQAYLGRDKISFFGRLKEWLGIK